MEQFKVGYSPERINPGDTIHRLATIIKIVAGCDDETLNTVANVYETIIEAGVHRASSIKVAEAAKVIENTQRDVNIALMNELSMIFHKLNIDTLEVLEAAGTKWNFLKFFPGLVGGHCIGVDPYYLTYKAEEVGYHTQVILSGRRINDNMGKFIAENTVKKLIRVGKPVKGAKVAILGLTFKENVGDIRNTKVIDVIDELEDYGIQTVVHDPYACSKEVKHEYNIDMLETIDSIENADVIVLTVNHDKFKKLSLTYLKNLCSKNGRPILIDVKGFFTPQTATQAGFEYWRL